MGWCRVILVLVVAGGLAVHAQPQLDWWQTAVFYQIYPRSFQDSDGDGIGDLKGITSRLEQLKKLGVGALWMSPIFKSPMADFGYDISNFYEIDPIFGTMADFDALIKRANELDLKVILDFVPNHSSDESEWFINSKANSTNLYSDFYVWRDPKGHNESTPIPPNEWMGQFFESVWTYVEERDQFYYHKYNYKQPDLNYRNDNVRKEMKAVMTFWLDRGAHGFRVDTVHTLVEDESFPDVPDSESEKYTTNQPLTYEVVKEWRQLLDEYSLKKDNITRVLMTEAYGDDDKVFAYYGTKDDPGAHFTFNFKFIIELNNNSKAEDFVKVISEWMSNMPEGATANWVIGNHDQPRVATRYGPDLAAGVAMLTLLLPGVGVAYNGEEIGMVNNFDISYNETQDPQGINAGPDRYMEFSRDFQRTPFQWDDTKNAGFSTADKTWLPVNSNYLELNLKSESSLYWNYIRLIGVRENSIIQQGGLLAQTLGDNIIAVSRELQSNNTWEASLFVILVNLDLNSEAVALNETFNLPSTIHVFTANDVSGYGMGQEVPSNEVVLKGHASVVFTDHPVLLSSGNRASGTAILALAALVLVTFTRNSLL